MFARSSMMPTGLVAALEFDRYELQSRIAGIFLAVAIASGAWHHEPYC